MGPCERVETCPVDEEAGHAQPVVSPADLVPYGVGTLISYTSCHFSQSNYM